VELIRKCIENIKSELVSRPGCLEFLSRSLLNDIRNLAFSLENDEILLLYFYLSDMLRPIATLADFLFQDRLKSVFEEGPARKRAKRRQGGFCARLDR
jgi:hypothetical protein